MNIPRRKLIWLVAVLLIFGGLGALTTVNAGAITRQLHDWKVLPEPERLTELYFADHQNLPTTYTPGQAQGFQFTVHNLEYRTTTYTYHIIQQNEAGTVEREITRGSFTLRQDESKTTPIAFSPTDQGARSKVVVKLSPVNEQISYWLDRKAQ